MRLNHAIAAALLLTSSAVMAHDLEKGPHGGAIVDVKGHHVEFISKDSEIIIYLTDDKDAPISSKGAEGKAVIQDAGKSRTVGLTPAEPNLLTGKTDGPLNAGAKIVVSGKLADGHAILARFVAK